ncbi:S9 family peptidase [Allomuricauda sp. F6463D]|uniref:S9 family peptidase n=1 Tax=Allomuricauda sp. F6463D TaxID=2926409 RepID=UPI001FF35D59|nr:S9 family peptidase [Muricauda sp. F6463D]MCK0159427.1 S9 family peptidase [Muricauda sp. F6463D]
MKQSLLRIFVLVICLIFATACKNNKDKSMSIAPPVAPKHPTQLEKHGDVRIDDYYWMNNREDQQVLDYLNAENEYYQKMSAHTKKFQEELFAEMKGRIKEDDSSVPYRLDGYWYITRYEMGKEYPIYSRKKESLDAEEQLLFDCNEMAKNHEYFNLRGVSISPDNTMASFGTDTISRRQYNIQIKNLLSGEIYPDIIENTTGSSVWANDNKTIFYTKKDPVTLRSDRIFKHVLGTPADKDELVFHEKDSTYNTFVYKTKSRKYIVIGSSSTLTSEYRILDADDSEGEFKVFSPREKGVEYGISHFEGDFYVLTNKDNATNFKLMKTGENNTSSEHWKEFIPHQEDVLLEDVEIFREYYVVTERNNGLNQMKIAKWDGSDSYYLPFDSETYVAGPSVNLDFDTKILRYYYNEMGEPYAIVDFDMETKSKTIKKQQEVLGGKFDKNNYKTERLWATARDGKKVPISVIYHKNTPLDGTNPLLQYGYGSYGATIDPYFSSIRLSLLDRGFIYAIAHVRGGEYLGRPWYEDGKLFNKKNSFTDFIDISKFLIEQNYTNPEHLYAMGGSAGGLLMGAVINMAPELYHGVIAGVPFVDVVTTMLDDTIPLTTGEYDEWGNPNEKEYYDYIKSYSPYDNVEAKEYPNMYVSTGLHDSQVQYWEPAKWVAKLREYKTGANLLFLDTNMDAGHGGASGRFEALKETAKEYAFILDLEGKAL